jgi:uncharacterized short protein YbdD (DUF466 family)
MGMIQGSGLPSDFPDVPWMPGEKMMTKKEFLDECERILQKMMDQPETTITEEEFFHDLVDCQGGESQ